MKDYYKTLGVTKTASDEEVKKAYHKLAHLHHPDRASGNETKFKEINEAYQVLSNKEKRASYDRYGDAFTNGIPHNGGGNPFGGGFGFNIDPSQFGDFGDLGDIMDAMFGGGNRRRKSYQKGADLEYGLAVTLEEAFSGTKKNIQFETKIHCGACKGAGHFEGEGYSACVTCDGKGEVRESQHSFFGNFSRVKVCVACGGAGKIPKKVCASCSGKGSMRGTREVEVSIAPGVADGQIIQITGMGETGERGAGAGDLYVRISVKKHSIFERRENDLHIKKEISLVDILLGKPMTVPKIVGGTIEVVVPENYSLKNPVKVSGEGMPQLGRWGSRGNLYIELDVKTPKKLSATAKKLLEELRREL